MLRPAVTSVDRVSNTKKIINHHPLPSPPSRHGPRLEVTLRGGQDLKIQLLYKYSRKEKTRESERASSLAIILSPSLRLSRVQKGLRIKNSTATTKRHARAGPHPVQIFLCEKSAVVIIS